MGGTFAKIIGWAFGLILVYLLVTNPSGTSSVIGSSTSGAASVFKTLQGR